MPLIEVTLAEGRNPDQIRAMMHEVHEAVLRTVDTRSRVHPRHRAGGAPKPLGDRGSDPARDGLPANNHADNTVRK